jgi:hypothetical protein
MKMKHSMTLGLAALVAMALTALVGAGAASATTLEVGGVTKNQSVTFSASLESGTTMIERSTSGSSVDTCTQSSFHGKTTSPYTGATLTAPLSSLTAGGCTHTTHIHQAGSMYFEHAAGTTNAVLYSTGAEWTTQSTTFGATLTCRTGTGTRIGTLTGSTGGNGRLDVSAIVNCGFFMPTATWEGSYVVTSPVGFGVSA